MPWLYRLFSFVWGAVFVYSGILKLRDPGMFLIDIRGFDMLPDPFAAWLALLLPWVEIICGLAVISGFFRSGGLLVLNLSLLMFFAAISYAQYRGLDIKCGCFGASEGTSNYLELYARDAVLLLIGVALLIAAGKELAPPATAQNL
jgi:putative oxidoreductase